MKKGFTLIELIVVMTITAFLALLGIPKFQEYRERQDFIRSVDLLTSAIHRAEETARGIGFQGNIWYRPDLANDLAVIDARGKVVMAVPFPPNVRVYIWRPPYIVQAPGCPGAALLQIPFSEKSGNDSWGQYTTDKIALAFTISGGLTPDPNAIPYPLICGWTKNARGNVNQGGYMLILYMTDGKDYITIHVNVFTGAMTQGPLMSAPY